MTSSASSVASPLALSSMARIGRVWFQWRSFSPIPLFLWLVFAEPDHTLGSLGAALGILAVILGEAIRVWAVGYAGSVTRTRGDAVSKLVSSGPYRHVRNPLYLGNMLMYTGASLAFGFWHFSFVVLLVSAVEYIFIVAYEEETLHRIFQGSYEEFCEKVPRWVPSISPLLPASDDQFSLKKALRSERSTFYSMFAMCILYILKQAFL